MSTHTKNVSAKEVEEQFLLHALHRLRTPEQRYIFTLMADLLSLGLAAQASATLRKSN
jgi:hypothetical protein